MSRKPPNSVYDSDRPHPTVPAGGNENLATWGASALWHEINTSMPMAMCVTCNWCCSGLWTDYGFPRRSIPEVNCIPKCHRLCKFCVSWCTRTGSLRIFRRWHKGMSRLGYLGHVWVTSDGVVQNCIELHIRIIWNLTTWFLMFSWRNFGDFAPLNWWQWIR